jgi:hypothetical protein
MEDLEAKIKHLEGEVARLIAELRVEVKYNHDDIADLMNYLQYKFPSEWSKEGTVIMDRIKREQ